MRNARSEGEEKEEEDDCGFYPFRRLLQTHDIGYEDVMLTNELLRGLLCLLQLLDDVFEIDIFEAHRQHNLLQLLARLGEAVCQRHPAVGDEVVRPRASLLPLIVEQSDAEEQKGKVNAGDQEETRDAKRKRTNLWPTAELTPAWVMEMTEYLREPLDEARIEAPFFFVAC